MTWQIEDLDHSAAADRTAVAELRRAVHGTDQPDAPAPPTDVSDRPGEGVHIRVARDGTGTIRGEGVVVLRGGGNKHQAVVTIRVHPAHRRDGVGRALAEQAERVARGANRTVLTGTLHAPWPGGAVRSDSGARFAEAMGYELAVAEVRSKLLTADVPALQEILDVSTKASTGYETINWAGQVPEELLEAVARINTHFMSDHPLGDLRVTPSVVTVDDLRHENEAAAAGGTFPYGVVAKHRATGEVVAHTVIRVPPGGGPHAKQWLTVVLPDHRGRRIADRIKVENLQQLVEHHPDVRWVWTESAEVNTAMRRINERMGFAPVDRWLKYQKLL